MDARSPGLRFSDRAQGTDAADRPEESNGLFTREPPQVIKKPGLSGARSHQRYDSGLVNGSGGAQFPAGLHGLLGNIPDFAEAAEGRMAPTGNPPPAVPREDLRCSRKNFLYWSSSIRTDRTLASLSMEYLRPLPATKGHCDRCNCRLNRVEARAGRPSLRDGACDDSAAHPGGPRCRGARTAGSESGTSSWESGQNGHLEPSMAGVSAIGSAAPGDQSGALSGLRRRCRRMAPSSRAMVRCRPRPQPGKGAQFATVAKSALVAVAAQILIE